MKSLQISLLLLMCPALGRNTQAEPGRNCLSYGPTKVRLTGTLIKRTFPGPPNYESIPDGDKPETYWLLALSRPDCVNADKNDSFNLAQRKIRRIQLVFLNRTIYKTQHWLLRKRAVVEGTLFGANNGHHHTPVLLIVSHVAKSSP